LIAFILYFIMVLFDCRASIY